MSKFFSAIINSKKTKHPNKEVQYVFAIEAKTAKDAKEQAYALLLEKEPETGTSEYFQLPKAEKITEDQYNEMIIEAEASELEEIKNDGLESTTVKDDRQWPELNEKGFYDKNSPGLLRAPFTLNDDIAEILTIQAGPESFCYGYRFISAGHNTVKPTGPANGEYTTLEQAAGAAYKNIENICEFNQTHGNKQQQSFAEETLGFDFVEAIMEQSAPPEDSQKKEDQIDVEDLTFAQHCKVIKTDEGSQVPTSIFALNEYIHAWIAIIQTSPATWDYSFQICKAANGDRVHGDIRKRLNHGYLSAENALINAVAAAGKWLESTGADFDPAPLKPFDETFITNRNVDIVMDTKVAQISDKLREQVDKTGKIFEDNKEEKIWNWNEWVQIAFDILSALDASEEYSDEQLQEMGEKLQHVTSELKEYRGQNVDIKGTLSNFIDTDWDNGTAAAKTMLNLRTLRAHFKECIAEIPTFHEWQKSNKGKNFDDYAEHFELDATNQEAPNNEKQPEPEKAPEEQTPSEPAPQPENESMDDKLPTPSALETPKAEPEPEPEQAPTTQDVVEIDDKLANNPNMALWMKGCKTDLNFTKEDQNGRLSIQTQYRFQKATEIWGPVGIGWGYEVLREWTIKGAPIFKDGTFTEFFEQVHKCEIKFWYIENGKRAELTQYGDTRKLYMSRNGYFVHDDECEKKSLSDALGKAMSMTGISADVYLGQYDDVSIKHRSEKAKAADKKVRALEHEGDIIKKTMDNVQSYLDKFTDAPSKSEIRRLEKLAITSLDALPEASDEQKNKKANAIDRVKQLAIDSIIQYDKDMQSHKEAANV